MVWKVGALASDLLKDCSSARNSEIFLQEKLNTLTRQLTLARYQCFPKDRNLCDTLQPVGFEVNFFATNVSHFYSTLYSVFDKWFYPADDHRFQTERVTKNGKRRYFKFHHKRRHWQVQKYSATCTTAKYRSCKKYERVHTKQDSCVVKDAFYCRIICDFKKKFKLAVKQKPKPLRRHL